MSVAGLTLDTGALIAVDRGHARVRALLQRAVANGIALAVPAGVVAQAWRDGSRQARLARLLSAPDVGVIPLDEATARLCGVLLARGRSPDVVDASVVLCAREHGHAVVTSDPDDLRRLDPTVQLIAI